MRKDNPTIWRYMNLYPFICQIVRKEFSFTRLSKLEDSTEGFMKDISIYEKICFGGKNKIHFEKEREKSIISHKEEIENYFVSCWSKKEDEDYALWKVFTNQNGGVAIITTADKFINSFSVPINVQKKEVTYKSFSKRKFAQKINSIDDCIFNKYDFYRYEEEYRFAITSKNSSISFSNDSNYLSIPINFHAMIDKIYLSPFMNNVNKEYFTDTLKILDIELFNKIEHSKIPLN
jgi:hypothetical protein